MLKSDRNNNQIFYEKHYDLENFSPESKKLISMFICELCKGVYHDPTLDLHGHMFCKGCIFKAVESMGKCPLNNEPLSKKELVPSDVMEEFGLICKIFCRNKKNGCRWLDYLYKYDAHVESECPREIIVCQTENCGMSFFRQNMKDHLLICTGLELECEGCKRKIKKADVEKHLESCLKILIDCPLGCKRKIERESLKSHCSECSNSLISCDFESIGCKEKIQKKFLSNHLAEKVPDHMLLIMASHIKIKDNFEKMITKFNDVLKLFQKYIEQGDSSSLSKENLKNIESFKILNSTEEKIVTDLNKVHEILNKLNPNSLPDPIPTVNASNGMSINKEELDRIKSYSTTNDQIDYEIELCIDAEAISIKENEVSYDQIEFNSITESKSSLTKEKESNKKSSESYIKKRRRHDNKIDSSFKSKNSFESTSEIDDDYRLENNKGCITKESEFENLDETILSLNDKNPSGDKTNKKITTQIISRMSSNNSQNYLMTDYLNPIDKIKKAMELDKLKKTGDRSNIKGSQHKADHSLSRSFNLNKTDSLKRELKEIPNKSKLNTEKLKNINRNFKKRKIIFLEEEEDYIEPGINEKESKISLKSKTSHSKIRFDPFCNSNNLLIEGDTATCMRKLEFKHIFALADFNLNRDKSFSWKINLLEYTYGWIAVGVCNRDIIMVNDYSLLSDNPDFKHGCFLLSSNNFSWNSNNKEQNNKKISDCLKFRQGTEIFIEYDNKHNKLNFYLENNSISLSDIFKNEAQIISPCVVFLNNRDSVKISADVNYLEFIG